jgi:hypothetical protein
MSRRFAAGFSAAGSRGPGRRTCLARAALQAARADAFPQRAPRSVTVSARQSARAAGSGRAGHSMPLPGTAVITGAARVLNYQAMVCGNSPSGVNTQNGVTRPLARSTRNVDGW